MVTKKSNKRNRLLMFSLLSAAATAAIVAGTLAEPAAKASAVNENMQYGGKFFMDYKTKEEAFDAAHEHNGKIVAEGTVLFKNDGTLPLNPKDNAVTVLGVKSAELAEGVDGTIKAPNTVDPMASGLRNAGFKVNPVMEEFYAALPSREEKKEVTQFSEAVNRSIHNYNDAAIIVLQRVVGKENISPEVALTGKKSADNKVNGTETLAGHRDQDGALRDLQDKKIEGRTEDEAYGWEHAHSAASPAEGDEVADANGNVEVKHGLQLSSSEQALIEYAKANFKHVVVTLNSSHAFEFYNLEKDAGINAIVWFGRPGIHSAGINAVAGILAGTINPSGSAAHEYERDFTADPTWQNTGTGRQFRYGVAGGNTPGDYVARFPNGTGADAYLTGCPGTQLSGIRFMDYEEDIYFGYKYYETFWNEIAQGHTSLTAGKAASEYQAIADQWHHRNVVYPFGYGKSYTNWSLTMGKVYKDKDCKTEFTNGDDLAEGPSQVKKLYAQVNVKNIGDVAGKKAVQIYVTTPYTPGQVEKPFVKLVGFTKTGMLKPGQVQTVTVEIDSQDIASFDANDANNNTKKGWELDKGQYILRAMGSSSMLRSKETNADPLQDEYDEMSFTISSDIHLSKDTYSGNEVKPLFSDPNELDYSLRPSDGSWSKKTGVGSVLLSRSDMEGTFPKAPTYDDLILSEDALKKAQQTYAMGADNNLNNLFGEEPGSIDSSAFGQRWNKEGKIPENWTQASEDDAKARVGGKCALTLKDMANTPITDAKWETFMNQLTYNEMKSLFTSAQPALACVGKAKDSNTDRPLNLNKTFTWADAPLQAATMNVDLIERMGELLGEMAVLTGCTGWWGPGANTNRSHFDGRSKEYYSQDAVHGGIMGAAASKGAASKGVIVYIKHFSIHNEEDIGNSVNTFISEQAWRENYLSAFKKVMQEGHAHGTMPNAQKEGCWLQGTHNYDYLVTMAREEWGWDGEHVSDMIMGQNSPKFTDPRVPSADAAKYTWNGGNNNNLDLLLRTTCTPMSNPSYKLTGVWDGTLRGGKGSVKTSWNKAAAVQCDTEYYWMRMTAKYALFKSANTVLAQNGIDLAKVADATITGKQGDAVNLAAPLVAADLNGSTAKYEVTAGTLPAGVTLNATTGAISGAPTGSGKSSVSITLTVDGWIKKTYKVSFDIASAWTLDLEGLKAGEAADGAVVCGLKDIPANATYAVKTGELPAGLTLAADGTITGTPTAAGTYTFSLSVSYKKSSGWSSTTVSYDSEVFTVVVTGESVTPEEPTTKDIVSVEANEAGDGYVITFSDGTSIEIKNGKDGADGQDGAPGKDGVNGQDGAPGKDGVNGQDGAPGKDGVDGKDGADGKGCAGSIAATSTVLAAVAALGLAIAKKKRD